MRTVVATTGDERTAAAGGAALEAGGNAVDSVVAAALAWPPALASAGALVAVGPGLGRGAALFRARVPGHGLSRQSRVRLLAAGAAASRVATPCAAQALVAILARWGTVKPAEAARTALAAFDKASPPPHQQALALLAREGVRAFTHGVYAVEAARSLGPLAGGLVTRRDMIEARPELGTAHGPLNGLWAPWPLAGAWPATVRAGEPSWALSVVAVDRKGAVASLALEAGTEAGAGPPAVLGAPSNTLLSSQPQEVARKVGAELPLLRAAAAGGELEQIGLAGPLALALALIEQTPPAWDAPAPDLLVVRRSPGGRIDVAGATSVARS